MGHRKTISDCDELKKFSAKTSVIDVWQKLNKRLYRTRFTLSERFILKFTTHNLTLQIRFFNWIMLSYFRPELQSDRKHSIWRVMQVWLLCEWKVRIFSINCWSSNKRCPPIIAALFYTHIKITATP